jgi:flagellar biogenesis protein FliO
VVNEEISKGGTAMSVVTLLIIIVLVLLAIYLFRRVF